MYFHFGFIVLKSAILFGFSRFFASSISFRISSWTRICRVFLNAWRQRELTFIASLLLTGCCIFSIIYVYIGVIPDAGVFHHVEKATFGHLWFLLQEIQIIVLYVIFFCTFLAIHHFIWRLFSINLAKQVVCLRIKVFIIGGLPLNLLKSALRGTASRDKFMVWHLFSFVYIINQVAQIPSV